MHGMLEDGSIDGAFNAGTRAWPLHAAMGADALTNSFALTLSQVGFPLLTAAYPYHGITLQDVGPYPMQYPATGPVYDGEWLNQLASSKLGSVIHELTHAFGIDHDFDNGILWAPFPYTVRTLVAGNLMSNAFRGIYGYVHPGFLPDSTYVSYATALQLNVSRWFQPDKLYNDNTKPVIRNMTGSGSMEDPLPIAQEPQTHLLPISFEAEDAGGLACAILVRELPAMFAGIVGAMPLSGTYTEGPRIFYVRDYFRDEPNQFLLKVYDSSGNLGYQRKWVQPAYPFNLPPVPLFFSSKYDALVGEDVSFDASRSCRPTTPDPFGPCRAPDPSLRYRWDFDGDLVYDTPLTSSSQAMWQFAAPGIYWVRLEVRLVDSEGVPIGMSVTEPLPIKVTPPKEDPPVWVARDSAGGSTVRADPNGHVFTRGRMDASVGTPSAVSATADVWTIKEGSDTLMRVVVSDPANRWTEGDVAVRGIVRPGAASAEPGDVFVLRDPLGGVILSLKANGDLEILGGAQEYDR